MNSPKWPIQSVCYGVLLVLVIASSFGCAPRPTAAVPPVQEAKSAPLVMMTTQQKQQARSAVYSKISTMTTEQKAAYFKAHPEDAEALQY